MKTQQVFILGALIIVACLISLLHFSNMEGMDDQESASSKNEGSKEPPAALVIKTNADFIKIINEKLSASPDPAKDKATIIELQDALSSMTSKNAATLLGEIGNPHNANTPRAFLKYMNWFASNCPIDSDTCTGLQ